MIFLVVLEKVENAFRLCQTRNKIQIGFAVLDTIVHFFVATLQPEFESVRSDAGFGQNLLDNSFDVLFLEDAAVLRQGEQPEGRYQCGFVQKKSPVLPVCQNLLTMP